MIYYIGADIFQEMLKQFRYREKVSSKIKVVPRKQRTEPVLEIGGKYCVSFGNNWAYPCTIREIVREFERTEVKIHIRVTEKEAFFRKNSILVYDPFKNTLFMPTKSDAPLKKRLEIPCDQCTS